MPRLLVADGIFTSDSMKGGVVFRVDLLQKPRGLWWTSWWSSGDFPNCDLCSVLLGARLKESSKNDIQQTQKTDEISRFLMNFVNNIANTIGGFLSDTIIYDPGNRKN